MEFGLCPFWLDLLQTGRQSPRITRGFLSTTSPPASLWHRILDHFSSFSFLVPDGMFRMRLLLPCLQDRWDFLDDQFQVSWFPLYREFLFASRDSPSPQRQCFASRDPASPRHQHSSRASSVDNPFERPHLLSSPTIHLPFQRR